MISVTARPSLGEEVDLIIVGAGIVGLAHAVEAVARGLSVAVVEREERAVGASVRNFGHCCITAQAGEALRYGLAARPIWLRLAKEAGFWASDAGTVVVARADDEYAVLKDLCAERGADTVVLLDAVGVGERLPIGEGVVGGAWFPMDLRVDPRRAVRAIARWLGRQGVRFHWDTTVAGIEPGVVQTNRGTLRGHHIVLAAGHDVADLFPDLAAAAGLVRCSLHMLRVAAPHGATVDPAVLTGTSLLRYSGFATSPSLDDVRARLQATHPQLLAAGLNLMFTQLPDGDLTVGDTHRYGRTVEPFSDEDLDHLILQQAAELMGVPALTVRQRWSGVYASAPDPFLVAAPVPGVRVVSVTSGIGMTTALGLAPTVLDDLLTELRDSRLEA